MRSSEFAWMNQAIFESLHHRSVVPVDLTALRPNCLMELGYALGNKQRVIITARDDTEISFDACALEAFQWNMADESEVYQGEIPVEVGLIPFPTNANRSTP